MAIPYSVICVDCAEEVRGWIQPPDETPICRPCHEIRRARAVLAPELERARTVIEAARALVEFTGRRGLANIESAELVPLVTDLALVLRAYGAATATPADGG